ncbi:hypothetical protein CFC21_020228 [Triticum aestivum]|uniref:Uncharacterized protein n=3 Tax=Triticum TaxID=4564 RepID=A0A3B6B924_WHEAT|nr:protein NRT1/ PTR FAMILY 5.10-like [Triticum aestivum]KAF7005081.1 hypothetical protein CFC21_020228 [Triticum aestivum]
MDTEVPFLSGVDEDGLPLAGVSDFRGRPVYRNTSGGWQAALFVVAMELASTFANYGVSANLITYLTGPLGHSNASAAAAVNIWSGTASLMPLLGAFLADSWLGRYRSIILASTLYALGYGMITLASTIPTQQTSSLDNDYSSHPSSVKVAFFYISLYLIAIAQGADKPCGLAFAADQFDPDHPQECAARCSFFNWWYFSIAIGIAVAVALVSYIQENLGWGIGFGSLCVIMISAFIVFLLGSPSYRLYAPTPGSQSPFTRLAHNIATLFRSLSFSFGTIRQHHPKDGDDTTKSEEVRSVLRLLPIWTACLAYGVVFAHIMTFFNKQGRTLDRRLFGSLELPPAALQTFGPAAILLFVPIYDRVLVPALRCMTGNPSGLTPLQRVGTVMVVSLATMCVAALVEARRLETAHEYGLVDDARATVPMSWVWLVPQYVMIGVADVFAMVGMQEFFYDQMPSDLRSLGLALYFSVMGIGGFISGALISLIDRVTSSGGGDSWFADNLNRAHLDYFYWLLAGLSAIELVLYIRFTISYVYRHKSLH